MYPYTGTQTSGRTSTGLSTQIIVKVDGIAIGAIQELRADQRRDLMRITEVGTDGTIEIVPRSATTFDLSINRIYFDRKTITESLNRSFVNIQAQRYPFDIYIYDLHDVETLDGDFDAADLSSQQVITTIYENCWIGSKSVSYRASDYIIMEDVSLQAEFCHTFLGTPGVSVASRSKGADSSAPLFDQIERVVDTSRPGSMDARGLRAIFPEGF